MARSSVRKHREGILQYVGKDRLSLSSEQAKDNRFITRPDWK